MQSRGDFASCEFSVLLAGVNVYRMGNNKQKAPEGQGLDEAQVSMHHISIHLRGLRSSSEKLSLLSIVKAK